MTTKTLQSLFRKTSTSTKDFKKLNWTGTFEEYLDIVYNNPKTARNAYQRLYDMIMSHGTEESQYCNRTYT